LFLLVKRSVNWLPLSVRIVWIFIGATCFKRRRTPARDLVMTALGARWRCQSTTFNQGMNGLDVPNLFQAFRQQEALMRRQLLKIVRQRLEFFASHRCAYLADSYGNSMNHY
jgi:hypothetical protein